MQTAATLDALIAKPRTTSLENEMGTALSDCRVQLFGPIIVIPPGAEKPPTMDINAFLRRNVYPTWPHGANADFVTGTFGANDVIVIEINTPATSDGRKKQMAAVESGLNGSFPLMRCMTIASQPQIGGGIRSVFSQSPNLYMKLEGSSTGPMDTTCYLRPASKYFITIVNRKPDGGASTMAANNEMKVHFNN